MKIKPRAKWPEAWRRIERTEPQTLLEGVDDYSRVWVSSDHHFGHKNIIQYSNRPFADIGEMQTEMIRRHNECVQPEDLWMCVGDFAFLNDSIANEILRFMNGYKILVVGNHDIHRKKLKQLNFDEICVTMTLELEHRTVIFSHYPIEKVTERFGPNYFNVHGHIHNNGQFAFETADHFNVCVEFHDYYPVTLSSIIDKL